MKTLTFKRVLEFGGFAAAAVLIAFGVVALVLGVGGRSTVKSNISQEYIVGSDDMTPAAIAPGVAEIKASQQKIAAAQVKAGVPASERFTFTAVSAPSCSVAGKLVSGGDRARCFAQYMRIHALESSGGLVYSQMGRSVAKPDAPLKFTDFMGGTSNSDYALVDPKTAQPVSNGARNLWVTETALTTALNLAYTAERISLFSVVVGIALLLSGIGFGVLAFAGALRDARFPKLHRAGRLTPAEPGTAV
jgi:hypothetical protein